MASLFFFCTCPYIPTGSTDPYMYRYLLVFSSGFSWRGWTLELQFKYKRLNNKVGFVKHFLNENQQNRT